MRRIALLIAAATLLAGPMLVAFSSGGYFEKSRLVAAIGAWALVLAAALLSPRPLPGSWPGRLALAGLVTIAGWTAASITWAPLSTPATGNLERLLLYVAAFVAAAALLRDRFAVTAIEPLLALGAVVVIGYGLAGRLLPGVIQLAHSAKAGDRLEQPLTYWNAEGALAAMGLVLCARLAGTESRSAAVRGLAAAAAAPLGLGVYLSYSRGALVAAAVGLVVLLAAAPTRSQLRALALAFGAGFIAAAVSAALPAVASLDHGLGRREGEGAVMLGVLALLAIVVGLVQARLAVAESGGRLESTRLGAATKLPKVAAAVAVLGLAGLVAGGLGERRHSGELSRRHGGSRLTAVGSRRYEYWGIGLRIFRRHPLRGAGAGAFRVVWLRERPAPEGALEVHSLPLEMAAELGVPGLVGLTLLVGGTGFAGASALRQRRTIAPTACAAGTVWLVHTSIDWDWQVPAVTLPALVLAGALAAAGEPEPGEPEAVGADIAAAATRPGPAATPA